MTDSEQTYDDARARALERLLRELAARIVELDARGELLRRTSELMTRLGDARTELFHYEVRATYDTPEIAESRRVVEEAKQRHEIQWERSEWSSEADDDPTS